MKTTVNEMRINEGKSYIENWYRKLTGVLKIFYNHIFNNLIKIKYFYIEIFILIINNKMYIIIVDYLNILLNSTDINTTTVSDYTYSRNTNADDKLSRGHTKRACISMHRDWAIFSPKMELHWNIFIKRINLYPIYIFYLQ